MPVARITSPTNRRRVRGFTLAESLVASTVLAASVVGAVAPLIASQEQSAVLRERAAALSLGRQLMEEISSKPYVAASGSTAPGYLAGTHVRTNYDEIADYDQYSDTTSSLGDIGGSTMSFGTAEGSYTRAVSVSAQASPSWTGSNGASADFTMVTVTVTTPRGEHVTLNRLFTKTSLTW